jgi:tRNA G18 (ribose-2'-O)-methylase SpoU
MTCVQITSRESPKFIHLKKLLKGRGLKKYGQSLMSGPKQVREVLAEFPEYCRGVVKGSHHQFYDDGLFKYISKGEEQSGLKIYELQAGLFRELDIYGTDRPLLLVNVKPLPKWRVSDPLPGCTLFVPFQDPVNVGSVIRSAAAFGVSQVVMLREAAHPFHHKATRVAGSTVFRVPIRSGPGIGALFEKDSPFFTLSTEGESLRGFRFPRCFGLIPGLEGPGVPGNLKGLPSISVPMARGVESLNAATATGIVLYEWSSQLNIDNALNNL